MAAPEYVTRPGAPANRCSPFALAPAAAAICYPFLLRAFHAVVGPPGAAASSAAIVGAALILALAFGVPFLGITLVLRPAAKVGARRLAYASVAAPTLYVFVGVAQALVRSPVPDEIPWTAIWIALAIASQLVPSPVGDAAPSVGRWRVVHGLTAALLVLYVLFHLANHLFGLAGPEA
ncbi:MAG: hypothetical protein ACM3IG_09575, partial [Myxococcales bacterium]